MLRTPFYDFHIKAAAKMVDFAGWEMPLLYKGIVEEHEHTRTSGSFFDVSHMGRLRFAGKEATRFLDHVLTRNVVQQQTGTSRYGLVCNEAGGILDDIIISRDTTDWLMVCNASNRLKLLSHFNAVMQATGMKVSIDDQTEKTAMVALQGPAVLEKIASALPVNVKTMKRFTFESADVMFVKLTVFRTGYTGEDGFEVILSAKAAGMATKMIGSSLLKPDATLRPAGLGARDTLRLEAGLPLYGHELNESLDPLSANLGWAVDLGKEFVGGAALREIQNRGPLRKLVGLELEGRRIARQGTGVVQDGRTVGEVTSGTFSPTLGRSIAMAYVDAHLAGEGMSLSVDLKGVVVPAKVTSLPFYKRPPLKA